MPQPIDLRPGRRTRPGTNVTGQRKAPRRQKGGYSDGAARPVVAAPAPAQPQGNFRPEVRLDPSRVTDARGYTPTDDARQMMRVWLETAARNFMFNMGQFFDTDEPGFGPPVRKRGVVLPVKRRRG